MKTYKLLKLLERQQQLHENLKAYKGKVAYAVSKNLQKFAIEAEALEAARKPSAEFSKYDEERIKLCTKHAVLDDKGNPKMIDISNGIQSFQIMDQEAFQLELKALEEKYQEAIDENKETIKKYTELLETEVEIDLWEIKVLESDIEHLDGSQIEPLMDFIEVEW